MKTLAYLSLLANALLLIGYGTGNVRLSITANGKTIVGAQPTPAQSHQISDGSWMWNDRRANSLQATPAPDREWMQTARTGLNPAKLEMTRR